MKQVRLEFETRAEKKEAVKILLETMSDFLIEQIESGDADSAESPLELIIFTANEFRLAELRLQSEEEKR